MRKVFSLVGAGLLAATTLVSPAEAVHVGTIDGSCGPSEGSYGTTNVDESQQPGDTVTGLFYRINFSNVPAPTTLGVLIRYNDELESQTGATSFVVSQPTGTFTSAIRANVSPEAQGGGVTRFTRLSSTVSNRGHGRQGGTAGSPQIGGGITEGEYVFYVYTGEMRDVPETVKDGPSGRRFFADESGFVGRFSCGVSSEAG